jgi:hypothetical protein
MPAGIPTDAAGAIPASARHVLSAAQGWLELGLPGDSIAELDKLPAGLGTRPEALELRWSALARQEHWDAAFAVAIQEVSLHPDTVEGWIRRSYAARRKRGGGLAEAADLLLPAVTRFPGEAVVRYNLACYAACSGKVDEAWTWFCKALAVGEGAELRAMALADEDLRPIWPKIALGS